MADNWSRPTQNATNKAAGIAFGAEYSAQLPSCFVSKKVLEMFRSIAPGYDRANDVLSFGIHRLWRRKIRRIAGLRNRDRVLDLCCGTGDLSFELARHGADVVGVDFVDSMLSLARQKSRTQKPQLSVDFALGDALALPFPDNTFDAVTVAFGIRNVDSTVDCLREMSRVLNSQGRLLVLEFGQPVNKLFRAFYEFYSYRIMPIIGGLITGNRSAYEYLPSTAGAYPAGEAFLALMREAKYSDVRAIPLSGGIAYIYVGIPAQSANREANVFRSAPSTETAVALAQANAALGGR